jgi:1,4-alpha-glucan branching enzyme
MAKYQWEICYKQEAPATPAPYRPKFGWQVIERSLEGAATRLQLNVYAPDVSAPIHLVGNFNDWGWDVDISPWQLQPAKTADWLSIEIAAEVLPHGASYMLLQNQKQLHDPAAVYLNEQGQCVFWDFERPRAYQAKFPIPDRTHRSVKVLQTDLPGFAAHFRDTSDVFNKMLGHQINRRNTYKFIAESGIIDHVAELGFNTIQFLPFNQSIDGDKWSFRYIVPFLQAINNAWGDPDDFAYMIDKFHEAGICVISDLVISHLPVRDFHVCGLSQDQAGLQHWRNAHGSEFWLGDETNWGTRRYDYANPFVREFIIQAALQQISAYRLDGFRIDNVDGILRHGTNGDGSDRPGGRETLRELCTAVYAADPHSYIHLESHFFKDGEAKYLVAPIKSDRRAIGATAYTSSRLTYYFHKEYMPKAATEISPWKIRDIIAEKEWGQCNSEVADFHNHDAAAGLMAGRATGSYAYDALILQKPELHHHAIGKIKVMEALISFGMEGRTLDMLQTHLLQTGTFEHDSTIHWYLEMIEANKAVLNFKQKVNAIMDLPAFWPINVEKRAYANVDESPKSLVIHRADEDDNQIVIYVNMASHMLFDYVIPVNVAGTYAPLLNSDELRFAGEGRTFIPPIIESEEVSLFAHFSQGLRIETIAPYQVLVFIKQ